ncbi:hypothetical protein RhiirC2_779502 [Rhizophagus irregularis]|uniref:Uncharacterized protein n=1 Tax=Rhizophagus irregularis TaxID=588596 RepID=A0A2N1M5D2_9GLOM|nr:hypothetical protein RhiirC2_799170 [Rhizophagus irregularis]PKK70590.1 hypothetical protein RhiirC2_779502 [Rhizophagus irregularis]
MIAGLWKLVYKPLIRLLKKTKELLDGNNFLCGRLLDGSVFPDSTLDFFDTWTSDGSSACSLDAGFDNLLFGFQEYL